ncbi:hypothetical protein FOZ63_033367, partial [Perkinsus olseni]
MVGILLDANLSFGRHTSHQCAKAKVMVLRVKTFARLSYGLGDDAVRAAWEQFGLSIATYGSEVWGHKALNSGTYAILTRLHNSMARVLLRAAASSSTVLLGVTCGLRHPAGAALSRWCKAWLHNDFYSQKKLCKEGKRVLQQLGLASDYPAKCERYKNWEGDVVSSQLFALDSDSGGRGGRGGSDGPDELVGPGGLVDRGGLVGHGEDGGSGPGFRSDHAERDPLSGAVDVGNGEAAVDRFLRGSALPQPDDGPDLEWLANARPSSPNEVNIFTDGSRRGFRNPRNGFGCMVIASQHAPRLFFRSLPSWCNICQDEVCGIYSALRWIKGFISGGPPPGASFRIHVDSKAAILSVASSPRVSNTAGIRVKLVWIRGHANHRGNEVSDSLANLGSEGIGRHDNELAPWSFTRTLIDEYISRKLELSFKSGLLKLSPRTRHFLFSMSHIRTWTRLSGFDRNLVFWAVSGTRCRSHLFKFGRPHGASLAYFFTERGRLRRLVKFLKIVWLSM